MFSPNTGKYGPGKTPYLDNFHEVDNNDTSKIRWWLKSWLQRYSIISYKHYSTYKLVNNKSKSWTKQKLAHFVYIYGKWRNSIFLWKIIDILETFGLKIRSSLYRRKDWQKDQIWLLFSLNISSQTVFQVEGKFANKNYFRSLGCISSDWPNLVFYNPNVDDGGYWQILFL